MSSKKRSGKWILYVGIVLSAVILLILLEPWFTQLRTGKPEAVPASAATTIQRVSLMLDDYPNASHAYLYAAQANGYFREEGLAVEILMPDSNLGDPLASVAAGGADLAIVQGPELLLARDRELPVQSIAAIVGRPLSYMTVPQASPIHSAKHLIGRTIGYAGKSYYEAIARQMLLDAGADDTEASYVNLGHAPNYASSFDNDVDAIIGPTLYRDRLVLEKKGVAVRFIEPMLSRVPGYYEQVLAANEQAVEADPELFKKLWRALSRGQQFVIEHPEQALDLVMSRQRAPRLLDEEIELQALQMLLALAEANEDPFGHQQKQVWSDTAKWLQDTGMLLNEPRGEDAFTNVITEE